MDLDAPEDVFDIDFFRENPKPFYVLARELYPGRYRPTIAHSFIRLLHDKGILLKHFTQNIDCLERQAGVPGECIVEAHGSFATQRCIECKTEYPDDRMHEHVETAEIPHCPGCNGLVKPDIVFFGEALPSEFFEHRHKPAEADLCIVMGTSLMVQPFASLPSLCRDGTPRVLINMDRVGGIGSRPDDVLLLGDCDAGVRKFAQALGWEEELEALWETTKLEPQTREETPSEPDEKLKLELERVTKGIDDVLGVTKAHEHRVRKQLAKEDASQSRSSENGLAHVFPHLAAKRN